MGPLRARPARTGPERRPQRWYPPSRIPRRPPGVRGRPTSSIIRTNSRTGGVKMPRTCRSSLPELMTPCVTHRPTRPCFRCRTGAAAVDHHLAAAAGHEQQPSLGCARAARWRPPGTASARRPRRRWTDSSPASPSWSDSRATAPVASRTGWCRRPATPLSAASATARSSVVMTRSRRARCAQPSAGRTARARHHRWCGIFTRTADPPPGGVIQTKSCRSSSAS